MVCIFLFFFFFFQAEDGIRDTSVTGVQTCALPISRHAEVEAEIEDPEDLLEVVQEELRARRFADTVRVQITGNMSAEMRQYLMEGLEVDDDSLYEIPEPLGKTDLMAVATTVRRSDLLLPGWKPEVP